MFVLLSYPEEDRYRKLTAELQKFQGKTAEMIEYLLNLKPE